MKTIFVRNRETKNVFLRLIGDNEKVGEQGEILVANSVEASVEKHLPVVNIENNIVKVNVSTVEHPMLEVHYIQFITIITNKGAYTKTLNYTEKPQMEYKLTDGEEVLEVYAYCNLHGLWKA